MRLDRLPDKLFLPIALSRCDIDFSGALVPVVGSGNNSLRLGQPLVLLGLLNLLLEPDPAVTISRPSPSDTSDEKERMENKADDECDEDRSRSGQLRVRQGRLRSG